MSAPRLIAIDGPSASGKSTVGRLLAQRLGYSFLDTGAMYRALTWLALKHGVDPEDAPGLARLSRRAPLSILSSTDGAVTWQAEGEELTDKLRRPEVEAAVSLVSRAPGVRQALVAQQRRLARRGRMVMAGRDIGTVVLPRAKLKVFLEASSQVRAERRYRELREQNKADELTTVLVERTGRIITSAALILVVVTGSFALADIVIIKALGVGIAIAIALDATVVRALLVPATMRLLGDWNWWAPGWLRRLLPEGKGGVS